MHESDLKRIEREFGIQLPEKYRAFLLDYPFPRYSWAGDLASPDDVELLLDLNRQVRGGISSGEAFVIGSNGRSSDYFIRLGDGSCGVDAYDEATQRITSLAKTFDDWLSHLAVENQAHADQYRKRWWEFWK